MFIRTKIGSIDDGFLGADRVRTMIAKPLAWSDLWGLANNPMPFEDQNRSLLMTDQPFPILDGYRHIAIVVDGDEVDKTMWLVG